MILELRLSNMFSLRGEVSLNLQAARIQTQKARELEGNLFTVGGEQLLKSVAVFGANASGKSNVIKAIRTCVEMPIKLVPTQIDEINTGICINSALPSITLTSLCFIDSSSLKKYLKYRLRKPIDRFYYFILFPTTTSLPFST